MKALKITLIIIASLLLIGGAGYLYASSGVKSKPGYAKFATPKGASVDTVLSLNIGPGGVGPARWLVEQIAEGSNHEHEMSERVLRSVLQELQGVQLRIYEVHDNQQVFDDFITESVTALKQESWQTLVRARDGNERIVAMQYGDETQIEGLSIMASTPDTALFLNLIGPFNPESIAESVRQMN